MAQYKGATSESYRALKLANKRKQEEDDAALKKRRIEEKMALNDIDKKFSSQTTEIQSDATSTIGLVTMAEMKAKQELINHAIDRPIPESVAQLKILETKEFEKFKQQKQIKTLSFDIDEKEEEEEEEGWKDTNNNSKTKIKKNPDVDTSYLPDRNRDQIEHSMRETFKKEWIEKQRAIKAEEINITFSYWDGSGHRFQLKMLKGNSIYEFLQKALAILRDEFPELRVVTPDSLMFIKEDLILPHYYTFYDFIISKARGKSGPLFQFDVKDDIRLVSDATIEKEETHAGKVVMRSWYERNKHIFPGNRWEPFDPLKTYSTYSFKDTKKTK